MFGVFSFALIEVIKELAENVRLFYLIYYVLLKKRKYSVMKPAILPAKGRKEKYRILGH